MTRLGRRQLDRLAGMAHIGAALIVPDDISRALCRRGLLQATGDLPKTEGSMIVITPAGLRALADAMEAGLVAWRPDWAAIRAARGTREPGFI